MSTSKILLLPGKYIQGAGAFESIAEEALRLGKHPVVLWDRCVSGLFSEKLECVFQKAGIKKRQILFSGETVRSEADEIAQTLRLPDESGECADVLIGIGGGKTLDMSKAAAAQTGLPLLTVPTVASNDSPCSSYTVWYTREGLPDGFDTWGVCPNVVLVDTQILSQAPLRSFISGIGDALTTWYEADVVFKSRALNCVGGLPTLSAMVLAQTCRDIIFEFGEDAVRAVRTKTVSPALEKVLEATILHSGIGFESGGLATGHQIANNLSIFPECHGKMHGEEVAFGLATQLCLDEDCLPEERLRVIDFLIRLGLPVTLEELGLGDYTRTKLQPMGKICVADGSFALNHVFKISEDSIVSAMIQADLLGKERLAVYRKVLC